MKTNIALILAVLALSCASYGVTWDVVNVSFIVRQGSAVGKITSVALSSRSYLKKVAADTSTPKSDLFVGFREDTGEVAVVRRSDEQVLYKIVSGLGAGGTASNSTGTSQSISVAAVVSSLNTGFDGYIYDTVSRTASGGIKSLTRTMVGGFENQTIIGTCRTTGKKIEL
jgi:hypothetical protein